MLLLAVSRYGRIRLGRDDERPEFSTGSWISMMFATGMGIGLIFWGVAEPLSHLLTPPMDMAEAGSPEAAALGLQYTIFHWGMHPWALYGVVGLALAYATFRKGRPNLLSSIVFPKKDPRHPARRAVDIFGLFITTFGAATSLGLGALQINSGLTRVFDAPKSNLVAIIAIAVLTAAFVVSAVSGTEKGIKWLANTNAGLAVALLVFVFVFGPTIFLLNDFTETIGGYLSQFIPMSFRTGAFGWRRVAGRLDDLLLGLVDVVGTLRRRLHGPHLPRPHDPAVRGLRADRSDPGQHDLVRGDGRHRPSASRSTAPPTWPAPWPVAWRTPCSPCSTPCRCPPSPPSSW